MPSAALCIANELKSLHFSPDWTTDSKPRMSVNKTRRPNQQNYLYSAHNYFHSAFKGEKNIEGDHINIKRECLPEEIGFIH